MKICVIYHSETGNTRHIAQHIASAIPDSRAIEVSDCAEHSKVTRFLMQCKGAMSEDLTTIEPAHLDAAGYDLIVFGSPVWAFKPTPAIHAAINALAHCEKKRAVAFATHGGKPGKTGETFKKWIEARGMQFAGFKAIDQKDREDDAKNADVVRFVTEAVPSYL
ncbi:MAG: NAD(P)H-dependent oxidoreductase [Methanoregula sp.]|nr:NAD(P)H-dependent oxidoreductase [Methanoregula sp.]